MKRTIIFLLLIQASVFTAKAQLGYNYRQYTMGIGFDYLSPSTSVINQVSHPGFHAGFGYNVSPYTTIGIEYQFGTLSGGFDRFYNKAVYALDPKAATYDSLLNAIPKTYKLTDPYELNYSNHFQVVNIHADVQLGEIWDVTDDKWYAPAKNFYVGTGVGLVFNNITDNHNRLSPDSSYYIGGLDKSQDVVIPVRVGYQYKFYNSYDEPSLVLELGYTYNFVLGYGLDGYADPVVITKNETFSGFRFDIKFNFGSVTSYRKALH